MIKVTLMKAQHQSTIAAISLLLMLWLSFAAIDHQVDIIPEHHSHHDCQLFYSIQNGVNSATFAIPLVIVNGFIEPIAEPNAITRPIRAYFARSPPMTELRNESL